MAPLGRRAVIGLIPGVRQEGLVTLARSIRLWIPVFVAVLVRNHPGHATSPDFIGLGHLSGSSGSSEAFGVSANGSTVVGWSGNGTDPDEAFRWTSASGMLGLGNLGGRTNSPSFARAVSDDGSVVVGYSDSFKGTEAFRWTADGGMIGLGGLPSRFLWSRAFAVSADGSVVVGGSRTQVGAPEPFRWNLGPDEVAHTPDDAIESIGEFSNNPFAFGGLALGVSPDGAVVVGDGVSNMITVGLAFRWLDINGNNSVDPSETLDNHPEFDLGELLASGYGSRGTAVSADGSVIVGESYFRLEPDDITLPVLTSEAFRWNVGSDGVAYTSDDVMEGLGFVSPVAGTAGTIFGSAARDLSADGSTVVGTSWFSPNGSIPIKQDAIIWNKAKGIRKLHGVLMELGLGSKLSGWTLTDANGISADGQIIAGTGINPNGDVEAWIAVLPGSAVADIDIKPNSSANPINLRSRGVIPVAILGSDDFDVADVDVTTLAFGPEGAPILYRRDEHFRDVNGDGFTDVVSHYRTQKTGIAQGDVEACVSGMTFDGIEFRGCDSIRTFPACGSGFELALLLPGLMWLRQRRRCA